MSADNITYCPRSREEAIKNGSIDSLETTFREYKDMGVGILDETKVEKFWAEYHGECRKCGYEYDYVYSDIIIV